MNFGVAGAQGVGGVSLASETASGRAVTAWTFRSRWGMVGRFSPDIDAGKMGPWPGGFDGDAWRNGCVLVSAA